MDSCGKDSIWGIKPDVCPPHHPSSISFLCLFLRNIWPKQIVVAASILRVAYLRSHTTQFQNQRTELWLGYNYWHTQRSVFLFDSSLPHVSRHTYFSSSLEQVHTHSNNNRGRETCLSPFTIMMILPVSTHQLSKIMKEYIWLFTQKGLRKGPISAIPRVGPEVTAIVSIDFSNRLFLYFCSIGKVSSHVVLLRSLQDGCGVSWAAVCPPFGCHRRTIHRN